MNITSFTFTRWLLLSLALLITNGAHAKLWGKSAQQINSESRAALNQLYQSAPGARAIVARSVAVLVFPSIVKAGIGIGGEVGKGILMQSGKTVGYYRIAGGSIGLQLGAQKRSQVIVFLDKKAFARFRNSRGWKAGVDGSVVLADMGTSGEIDTHALNAPIVGFVLGEAGLMYNVTLEGSRIWKFNP